MDDKFIAPRVKTTKRLTKYTLRGGFFALLTLAATVPFLLGCLSPALRELGIYRVDVAQLADELIKISSQSNHTKPELVHPSLPQYWFFGYSGICDFYTSSPRFSASGEARCRYGFPPDQNVLSVVEGSMRTALAATTNGTSTGTDHENTIKTVVSAWGDVIAEVPGSKLRDKESKVASQNKAACALVILAIILDATSWIIAVWLGEADKAEMAAYLLASCSAIFAVAAGACAILSMNEGIHGVTSSVGNVSGSLVILFISALLKFPAVKWLLPREVQLSHVMVGEFGETFVYQWLADRIPDFSGNKHWSSRIYPVSQQGNYADFNYQDNDGYMAEALRGAGVQLMPEWGLGTKYHLEVKSTQAECNERPMKLSPNQINKMKQYSDGREAYILVRVFRVGTKQMGVRFFPRPWEMVLHGQLVLGDPNDDEGNCPLYVRC